MDDFESVVEGFLFEIFQSWVLNIIKRFVPKYLEVNSDDELLASKHKEFGLV